ncbi:hypothetical protein BCR37DRAFT_264962 [Protomyces lactucae-debilis]|uniref:Uncharacterized protein n=1 Tax=Protomyces lactucae-debilis TaxID=2754530 RepID=A0A1Y2FK61_PROLT|nr:uncharacterized protein BCR37DRAFT_264962 [Protomyces lactucae-debilis]ORY84362.1 hypothetical protein BCR37DRAFT_264962 [Protomyces lactucae-debilis]
MKNVKSMFQRKQAHTPDGTDTATTQQGTSPRPSATFARPIQEPEYKLSSVSPEGTFIPPSPPEKTSFLSRFRPSTNHAAAEPKADEDSAGFVIPRASFDGYRRSFDIRPSMDGNDGASLRSHGGGTQHHSSRQSLDVLQAATPLQNERRSSYSYSRKDPGLLAQLTPASGSSPRPSTGGSARSVPAMQPLPAATLEADFEEVSLADEEDDKDIKKKRFWQRTTKRDEVAELRALGTGDS